MQPTKVISSWKNHDPGLLNDSSYVHFFSVRGVSEDFVVPNTTHSLMGLIPQPFVVAVTLRLDGIALEPDEEFALNLGPTNPTAMDILAGGTLGLFALPEISVVIRDLESKKCL